MKISKKEEGISIIICAYQRDSYLIDIVSKLLEQSIDFDVEIIVIYKGKDFLSMKKKLITVFARNFDKRFSLKCIKQISIGVARARNLGIINTIYEIIVFIDDDTFPVGNKWLHRIYETFQKKHVIALCGKISFYESLKKNFMYFKLYYTWWSRGGKKKFLALKETPPSAQLAIRKNMLLQIGGFRGEIGRSSKLLISGEDDELTSYLGILGIRFWYDPQLIVRHRIPLYRQTLRYLSQRSFWQGPTDAINRKYIEGFYKISFYYVFFQMCRYSKKYIAYMLKHRRHNESYWVNLIIYLSRFLGEIYGCIYTKIFVRNIQSRPIDIYKNI